MGQNKFKVLRLNVHVSKIGLLRLKEDLHINVVIVVTGRRPVIKKL